MKPGAGRARSVFETVRWVPTAALLAIVLAASPARGQSSDLRPLLDRLERLERDLRTLNVQLSRGGPPPAATPAPAAGAAAAGRGDDAGEAAARLEVRLTALEEELRAVTGQGEGLAYQLDQINQRLDKLVGDVDFRLGALEKAAARPAAAVPAPTTAAAPQPALPPEGPLPPHTLGVLTVPRGAAPGTAPAQGEPSAGLAPSAPGAAGGPGGVGDGGLPEGTPRTRYDFAFGLLRQARYDQAEAALRAFLQAHGNDPLASNARYWLGETYYVRGNWVQAAEVFLQGYQKEPKGPKAPDSLLKLGMSLANLDKKREACAAFVKLGGEFPDLAASLKTEAAKQRQRSGCP